MIERKRSTWSIWLVVLAVVAAAAVGVAASACHGGADAASATALMSPLSENGAENEGIVFAGEHVRLTAYFLDGAVRIVFSDGQERVLPQVISASGARFSDGSMTFWNKGDEALLQRDGHEYTVRVVDSETDVWERARRAGVTLRAIGQEPGWLLEIRDNRYVDLLLDYGDTQLTTPVASMEVDFVRGETTYRVMPPTSPLRLTVYAADGVCYDGMSGEGFAVRVVVDINDGERVYRGCGRWLN